MKPKKRRAVAQNAAQAPAPIHLNRSPTLLVAASLALLTLLAFSNSFSTGFVLDNKALLLQDPRIRELTGENIHLILQHTYWWPTGEAGLYRPFTTLSYLFNYAVLGNASDPAGYHWINFILHLANVLLVYALARGIVRDFWPSFFTAAIWAVHPVLTESVTNMIGRADLLSGLAILSGFLMYLRSTKSTGPRRLFWLAGLAAATTIGAFSKESAIVIVAVILLFELTWWRERKQAGGLLPPALLSGCVAVLIPIAAMLYQRSTVLTASRPAEFPFTDNPIVGAEFWIGRLTAIKVMGRYLWLTLWPANLSSDYSDSQIPLARGSFEDWLAWIVVLAAVTILIALYWRSRTAFFFASFAAITLLPMSNLLVPIGTIMAERFLYVPAMGLLACLVLAIYAVAERIPIKHFAPAVLCLIALLFAVRTWIRNRDWQDERSMAEATVHASPNSFKAHKLLAAALDPDQSPGPNLDAAIQETDHALAILGSLPDSRNTPEVYRMAGGLYLSKGDSLRATNASESLQDYQRALQFLKRSIAIDQITRAEYDRNGGAEWARRHSTLPSAAKGDPETRWMLATAYLKLGDAQHASTAAAEGLALHPVNPEAYRQISRALAANHRIDEAAIALLAGALITSDFSLRSDLLNLYRDAFGATCALIEGPNGPAMNPACDLVHRQLCAASIEIVKAAVESEHWDVAKKQKQNFVQNYGCPSAPLDQVFPD